MSLPSVPSPSTAAGGRRPTRGLLLTLGWDVVLVLALGMALLVMVVFDENTRDSRFFTQVFDGGAPILLAAVAFGLSVRAGVPNLAVGALAALGGAYAAAVGLVAGAFVATILAVLVGVVVAVLVVGLRLPAWLVTTITAAAVLAIALAVIGEGGLRPIEGGPLRGAALTTVAVLVVLVSVGGGILGLLPQVRALFTRSIRAVSGGAPRSWPDALVAVAVLVLSSVVAVIAGVLLAGRLGAAMASGPTTDLMLTAVVAPVLGGTLATGRRGGVVGTAAAALLLQALGTWIAINDADIAVRYLLLGVAGLVGLGVGALIGVLSGQDDDVPPAAGAVPRGA